jgi:hypothetical protein
MTGVCFIRSTEAGKRLLCKRTQLRYVEGGEVLAIDLDKAKVNNQPFPSWFTVRSALPWDSSSDLRTDLVAAAAAGEALVLGAANTEALTGMHVRRDAIVQGGTLELSGLLPVDMDGVEVEASNEDLLEPARIWDAVLMLLRMPSYAAGVLQFTGSQAPLTIAPARARLRIRAYFLLEQPVTLAAAKMWAASLPAQAQVDRSAYDRNRIHFAAPPLIFTSAMEPVPDFLPNRFFAFGHHKVALPCIPAPLATELFGPRRSDEHLPLGGEVDVELATRIDRIVLASLAEHPISAQAGGWHGAIRSADWAVVARLMHANIGIDTATITHVAQRMQAQLTHKVEAGQMVGRSAQDLDAELSLAERQRSLIGAWRRQTAKALKTPPIPEISGKAWPSTAAMKQSLPSARQALHRHILEATSSNAPPSPDATLIVSPPGTGKTHACAKVAIERAIEGFVVEYYGPHHRLLRELNQRLATMHSTPKVAHHVGRNHVFPDGVRACVRWLAIEPIVERIGAHEVRRMLCQDKKAGLECTHLNACRYINNEDCMRQANIRLLTHAILVSDFTAGESEFSKKFGEEKAAPRRRIAIIDETPKTLEARAYLPEDEVGVSPAFLQWLQVQGRADSVDLTAFYAAHGGYLATLQMLGDAERKLAPSVRVKPGMSDEAIQAELKKAQLQVKPGIPGRGSDTRVRQWNFVKLLRKLVLSYPQGGRLSSLWTTSNGILQLSMALDTRQSARLHPSYFSPRVVLLDATPDRALLHAAGMQVTERNVDVVDGLFTVQIVNADWYASKISPSKAAQFAQEGDTRVESFASGRLLRLMWLRWALGVCMNTGAPLTVLPKAARSDAGLLRNASVLHYGALRGLDEFGSRSAVVLLGGPLPRITTMVDAARIRYAGSSVTGTMQQMAAEQITDAAGNNYLLPLVCANNPAVDHCLQQAMRDELRQAAYRLRPENQSYKPVAIAANNIPLRSQVDLVVDFAELVPSTAACRVMAPMTVRSGTFAPLSAKWLYKLMTGPDVSGTDRGDGDADFRRLLGDNTINEMGMEMRKLDLNAMNGCLNAVWRLLPPDVRKLQTPQIVVVKQALAGSQGRSGREINCLTLDTNDDSLAHQKSRNPSRNKESLT